MRAAPAPGPEPAGPAAVLAASRGSASACSTGTDPCPRIQRPAWPRTGRGRCAPEHAGSGLRGRAAAAAAFLVSLGQLVGLRHAAFGDGGDDLACAPVVDRGQAPGADRFQRDRGGLVELARRRQREGQVEAGQRGPPRPGPLAGCLDCGEDLAGYRLGGRGRLATTAS